LASDWVMPKRSVLFIVPILQRAGAENQLVILLNRLPAEKFDKYLLSYRPGDDLKADVDTSEIEIYELRRKGRLDFSVGRDIGRIIDEREIDIVHCTLQNALLFGYMGVRFSKRKPKLITSIHTTRNAYIKLDIADHLVYRPLLKRCDQIWFVSSKQASLWTHKMPFVANKAIIIHNGIDLNEFEPTGCQSAGQALRESLGISEDEKVLCCIAGFRSEKLHSVLIDAFWQIRAEGISCRLLLAGVGETEQAVQEQVSSLNLDESVEFLGSLPDVRGVLAASDCKVLVSAAETFSMAMLEAMAMRVPVITTSVGGASEAIDDGVTGFLVRPGNAHELATKIKVMLSNDDRRMEMGKRARQVVVEKFSVDRMVALSATNLSRM